MAVQKPPNKALQPTLNNGAVELGRCVKKIRGKNEH
jgi:hypothetical protein